MQVTAGHNHHNNNHFGALITSPDLFHSPTPHPSLPVASPDASLQFFSPTTSNASSHHSFNHAANAGTLRRPDQSQFSRSSSSSVYHRVQEQKAGTSKSIKRKIDFN